MPPARNAPCPCGSRKRYKDCHGALTALQPPAAAIDASDATAPGRLKAALDEALAHQVRGDTTAAEFDVAAVQAPSPLLSSPRGA